MQFRIPFCISQKYSNVCRAECLSVPQWTSTPTSPPSTYPSPSRLLVRARSFPPHTSSALLPPQYKGLALVVGASDGTVRLVDLRSAKQAGRPENAYAGPTPPAGGVRDVRFQHVPHRSSNNASASTLASSTDFSSVSVAGSVSSSSYRATSVVNGHHGVDVPANMATGVSTSETRNVWVGACSSIVDVVRVGGQRWVWGQEVVIAFKDVLISLCFKVAGVLVVSRSTWLGRRLGILSLTAGECIEHMLPYVCILLVSNNNLAGLEVG